MNDTFFEIPGSKRNQLAEGYNAQRNINARRIPGSHISGVWEDYKFEYIRPGEYIKQQLNKNDPS